MKAFLSMLALSFTLMALGQSKTISVVGTASKEIEPDRVGIRIIIENKADGASKAQAKTHAAARKVIEFLGSQPQIERVKTTHVELRAYQPNSEDYISRQTIGFTLSNIGSYDDVIVSLLELGVTGIGEVRFESSKESQYKDQLLQDAMREARRKANILAMEAGYTLGKAINISETKNYGGVRPYSEMSFSSRYSAISPGTLLITTTLYVDYELN